MAHGKAVPGLDRVKFRSMLHHEFNITDDLVMDGGTISLFHLKKDQALTLVFTVFRTFDKDNDGFLSVKEWITGLSVFLRGTFDEKIKCKF